MRQTSPTPADKLKGWHRADIIAAVNKRGFGLTTLAYKVGVSPTSMKGCVHKPHPTANRALAKFLGVHVHELWPDWFDREGKRIPGANHSRKHPLSLRQKRNPQVAKTSGPARGLCQLNQ